MTERTIEHMARELAGRFYDEVRSAESRQEKIQISQRGRIFLQVDPTVFRKTFPTVKDYLAGRHHGHTKRDLEKGIVTHVDDGQVRLGPPGWLHWYDQARQMLVDMLDNPMVHDNLKAGIYDAILEDRQKEIDADGKPSPNITQRHAIGARQ